MKIQFNDLAAQQRRIREDAERRIRAVLDHGKYILGPEVEELEEKLAAYVGVQHCVTCASGTDALLMGLMAQGIGPGDAVFTTPFTFIASAEVIALLGATPVFVDIDPHTFNLNPTELATAVGRVKEEGRFVPRAVIPVDLFGLPAEYDAIMEIAGGHGLFVMEDAAQSFGAVYRGRRACSLADLAATSFFPAKPLGCYGDGGALFTNDDALAETLRSIRVHGKGRDKYDNVRLGVNGRLDTMQAAVLLAKFEIFPAEFLAKQNVAAHFSELLGKLPEIVVPYVPPGMNSAWAQYSILSPRRAELQRRLSQKGIPSAIYYPTPLHRQPVFAGCGHSTEIFPVAEAVSEKILSLPMHPYLSDEQVCFIAETIGDK